MFLFYVIFRDFICCRGFFGFFFCINGSYYFYFCNSMFLFYGMCGDFFILVIESLFTFVLSGSSVFLRKY